MLFTEHSCATAGSFKVQQRLSCYLRGNEYFRSPQTPLTPHHHLQHDPRFFPLTSTLLPPAAPNTTLWSAIQVPTLPQQFQPAAHTQGYFCSACINHHLPEPSPSSPSSSQRWRHRCHHHHHYHHHHHHHHVSCVQKYPKAPKRAHKHPKVPQSTQKYLKVPKSTSKYPKVLQSTQRPKVLQST